MYKTLSTILIILFLISVTTISKAQIKDQEKSIENLIEEIAGSVDEDLDYTSLIEDLNFYAQNPLNLNKATREDLEKFQFLDDFQIEGILAYQKEAGEMQTIYELQLVDGFTTDDIRMIIPFVKVGDAKQGIQLNLKKAILYGNNTILLRTQFVTQEQKGYSDYTQDDLDVNGNLKSLNSRYLGNNMKYYARYKFQYKNKISFGITAEKDQGEEFFAGSQKKRGFDYYTAHLLLKDIGVFKTIALGDYQVMLGQGLTMWSGMAGGKSSYVMNINKKYRGIRKYSSTDENLFMRGAASTVRLGSFDITGFVSHKKIDANIQKSDSLDNFEEISSEATSFQITGMHRTPGELEDRKTVSETIYGGNLTYNYKTIKVGANLVNYTFGMPLNKDTKPYNQFDFEGKSNTNASFDYQANIQQIYFFGEEAISANGGHALLNGALFNLAPQITLSALHRYYSRDYQAYYAAGFGESANTNNESGLYLGTKIYPFKKWELSAYFDAYKFQWLKSTINAPSNGFDYFVQANYHFSRFVNVTLKYKQETKSDNSSEISAIKSISDTQKKQFRFQIDYSIAKNITLKNRIEIAEYKKENESIKTGYVLYQDVAYYANRIPLKLNFRFGMFDAPYDARIYTYETDILYGYSIPGLSGKGIRTYLTLQYTIIEDKLDIWLRYAQYHYTDKTIISSGLNEINGRNSSEVKIQIRIKI